MLQAYREIEDLIRLQANYHDVYGAPRYQYPDLPNHLMGWICCQACKVPFWVGLVESVYLDPQVPTNVKRIENFNYNSKYDRGADRTLSADWVYVDPPDHGHWNGNCVGCSMCSLPQYEWEESAESAKIAKIGFEENHLYVCAADSEGSPVRVIDLPLSEMAWLKRLSLPERLLYEINGDRTEIAWRKAQKKLSLGEVCSYGN